MVIRRKEREKVVERLDQELEVLFTQHDDLFVLLVIQFRTEEQDLESIGFRTESIAIQSMTHFVNS